MINYDDVAKENIKTITQIGHKFLMIMQKIYLYVKDPVEAKYQYLI